MNAKSLITILDSSFMYGYEIRRLYDGHFIRNFLCRDLDYYPKNYHRVALARPHRDASGNTFRAVQGKT